MRLTVIHNPTAGSANMSRSELEAILRDAGYHVRYQTTNGTWKKALHEPADLIVAAGGDGTVRKVATELAGTSASPRPFAVVPLGTANNFARALGIRDDLASRARQWRRARPILLDLGTIIIGRRARLFVEGAGGGLMAQAIARGQGEIEERSAGPRDETRQVLAMLARLANGIEPARWEIELDGQDASGDYIAVEALNIGLVGPYLTLALTQRRPMVSSTSSLSTVIHDQPFCDSSTPGSTVERHHPTDSQSAASDALDLYRRKARRFTSTIRPRGRREPERHDRDRRPPGRCTDVALKQ